MSGRDRADEEQRTDQYQDDVDKPVEMPLRDPNYQRT
jgi:hypothetical protein